MLNKIARILVIVVAWLMGLSLVYLFIIKLKFLRAIFHS